MAVNHFVTDTDAEVAAVQEYAASQGSEAIVSRHWELGSEGAEALAKRVAEVADSGASQFAPIYGDDMPLLDKINRIAKSIYRADEVLADKKIRDQLKTLGRAGIWQPADLHGENAVQLLDRSEPARRADRSFGAGA